MTLSRGYLHVSEEPHVNMLMALNLVQGSEPPVTLVTTSPPRDKRHLRKFTYANKLIVD